MAPDSLPVELVAVVVAVAAVVLLAATWDTARPPLRAAAAGLCVVTAATTALVWVNRQVETYPTWSSLLGTAVSPGAGTADDVVPQPGGSSGGRLRTFIVAGKASGLTMTVIAYLPAAYDRSPGSRFPVIEAFHGFPGSPPSWLHRLDAADHLDREIAAGRMAPTVVLFPSITPDPLLDTECTNLAHGPQVETFLTVDVPAAANARLHVRADRNGWGLIGYSAGGFCATNLVLRQPGQYAAAASLSGYADPGIAVGDGTENTSNNAAWRLRHLPVPAVALYLTSARTDRAAMRDAADLARLVRAPMSVTQAYVRIGGHNDETWQAMEAPAFDWLSGWLGRPVPTA